ncbi:response regulator [Chitinophaga defluvii]|uniref:Response regulator n=1 Tax=Chitinophaga defluvii TaxID=3163343 RepID=A0ABV2T3V4_9BACT
METKKDILIIDDDMRNIYALKAVLRSRGLTCISAGSAEEGFRLLSQPNNVGLVLMDIMMPDMDGYEAIATLRHSAHAAHLPIVAVTAQAMVGDREKCLAAGADNYISKPIDVDELLVQIQQYLSS